MLRLLIFVLLGFLVWRVLRGFIQQQVRDESRRQGPSTPESLVRCERCGIRVPASEIAQVRANCRQCADEHR